MYKVPADMTYEDWYNKHVLAKDNIEGAKYKGTVDIKDDELVLQTLKKFEKLREK